MVLRIYVLYSVVTTGYVCLVLAYPAINPELALKVNNTTSTTTARTYSSGSSETLPASVFFDEEIQALSSEDGFGAAKKPQWSVFDGVAGIGDPKGHALNTTALKTIFQKVVKTRINRQNSNEDKDNEIDIDGGELFSMEGGVGKQESGSKEVASGDSQGASAVEFDSDEDEPEGGGDGMGGGILGLLAGLSGGEDGQSDLGSLLAAVSGIVANLSGDGFDLNSLIASAVGLLAGVLSDGMTDAGTTIAGYLNTVVDSITGGGAQNNGQFFGNFLRSLITGSSGAGDPEDDSDEGGGEEGGGSDSGSFFLSLIGAFLGGSFGGSSGGCMPPCQ